MVGATYSATRNAASGGSQQGFVAVFGLVEDLILFFALATEESDGRAVVHPAGCREALATAATRYLEDGVDRFAVPVEFVVGKRLGLS